MVVKALMEKKAKEMETTITEISQANKETQIKLNSCEFSLQIKEHEVTYTVFRLIRPYPARLNFQVSEFFHNSLF